MICTSEVITVDDPKDDNIGQFIRYENVDDLGVLENNRNVSADEQNEKYEHKSYDKSVVFDLLYFTPYNMYEHGYRL